MNEPTHLDLFSGIGGFALAAQWAGYRTVGFCEIEPYAQAIIKARFGAVADTDNPRRVIQSQGSEQNQRYRAGHRRPIIHSDITKLDGTRYRGIDLLTGGFPCQPYSVAGKRRGSADDRALWPEMRRVIEESRPRWILGENVAGIINMELDQVLSDLESIGYTVGPIVIPACAVDAPHRRDRVWIVAHASQELRNRSGCARSGGRVEPSNTCIALANANEPRPQGRDSGIVQECPEQWTSRTRSPLSTESATWLPEPDVGRVANGIPSRVDRLKGLGNAIVPQVAYEIIRHMKQ